MHTADWRTVDHYLVETFIGDDSDLTATLVANQAHGLPAIDVSPTQGKFLYLLTRMTGARRVLEIGTLGGYSTTWFARAVGPEGRVVTLEYQASHAQVARENLDRAGVGERVEIRVGAALDTLPDLRDDGSAPFDLVFIDADKPNDRHYVEWALKLTRSGAVVVLDNVIRSGAVVEPDTADPAARAVRDVLELLGSDPRLDATALQTVGSKGWDGMAIAVVK